MAHTIGGMYTLIPDIQDMWIHALNPIRPRAMRMEHEKRKYEFNEYLSFHGSIDIQRDLPFGSP